MNDAIHYLNTRDYSVIYMWTTNLLALAITCFYAYALKNDFNPVNAHASIPALVHVVAAIGISLAMFASPKLSLFRLVHLVGLMLVANLG